MENCLNYYIRVRKIEIRYSAVLTTVQGIRLVPTKKSEIMASLRIICVVALLVACASANKLKPSQWVSPSELEQTPGVDEISLQKLENMSVEKGSQLMEKICKYFERKFLNRAKQHSIDFFRSFV